MWGQVHADTSGDEKAGTLATEAGVLNADCDGRRGGGGGGPIMEGKGDGDS